MLDLKSSKIVDSFRSYNLFFWRKKAVAANLALSERERSPIKLALYHFLICDVILNLLRYTTKYTTTLQLVETSSATYLNLQRSNCDVCIHKPSQ